jgi:glycosyltransferase involved in cell wall biosynthesis
MKETLEKPTVSIIMPTFNSSETLEECFESIQKQGYPFYEVIVVDNFSSDDTIKIAERFKTKIIKQKCNPALARNIGVTNATGKYALFLDSDQVLSPSVIAECVNKCENESFGMVRIPEVFIGKGFWDSCSAIWKNYYFEVEKLYGDHKDLMTGEPRFFVRVHIIRVGMLDTGLLWGEDFDLYSRLKKMNIKETFCKSKLYHYEPTSIKNLLTKNFRYGRSMTVFVQQTRRHVIPLMFKHALLTFREVTRGFKRSPTIVAGCATLLCLKAFYMATGLITGLLSTTIKR